MHLGLYQMVTGAAHLAANYAVELTAAETDPTASLGALMEPRGSRARITALTPAASAPSNAVGATVTDR